MTKRKGGEFSKYILPIVDVLKSIGGSGTSSEVTDAVIDKLSISEDKEISEGVGGEVEVEVETDSEELDSDELPEPLEEDSVEVSEFDELEETTSAVPQTQTYSQEGPQFKVNRFHPSAGRVTSLLPEPDLEPDQASEAMQLDSEEDQLRVIVDPLGVFSVFEENSAPTGKLNIKTVNKKNLYKT